MFTLFAWWTTLRHAWSRSEDYSGEGPKDHWAQLGHVELDCQISNWQPQEERRSQKKSCQSVAEDFEGHRAPPPKNKRREGGNRRHDYQGGAFESLPSHITERLPQEQDLVLQIEREACMSSCRHHHAFRMGWRSHVNRAK